MAAQLCQLALRPARRRGRVVVAIRCRDGRRFARRSDDGSLASRGVAFVRAARAAWSISLRTQRSLRRRTVDTSQFKSRHNATPRCRAERGLSAHGQDAGRERSAGEGSVAEESDVGVGQSREASASRDHQNRTAPALRLRRSGAVCRSRLSESNRRPSHVGFAPIA